MPNRTHGAIAPNQVLALRAFSPAGQPDPTAAELLIYGDIGESWSDQSVLARDVVQQLSALPASVSTITVRINSYGGSVPDGLAIFNALRSHPATVSVQIEGVAASIASLIAMAADTGEIRIGAAALVMVHAPWGGAVGNSDEMRRFAGVLDTFAAAMGAAYAAKTGKPLAEIMALLNDGADHWYTGAEAIAAGFADALLEADASQAAGAAASLSGGLSRFFSRAPDKIAAALRILSPGENTMLQPTPAAAVANRDEILAAERTRRSTIRASSLVLVEQMPSLRTLVDAAMDDPSMTPEAFGTRMLAHLGSLASPANGGGGHVQTFGASATIDGTPADFVRGASDGIVLRAGIALALPHAAANDFKRMSVSDLARACLARAGRSPPGFGSAAAKDLIKAAMTTSDFPLILENALGKSLRAGYEAEPQSHRQWARFVLVPDFKAQSRVILGSAPDLAEILEGAEYTAGSMDEDKASYSVAKFGKGVRMTWEALVNDDLGAFMRIPQALGQAARRKEADIAYDLLLANALAGQTMQDAVALFHATHANLAASTVALDAAALGTARTLLRKQTAVGGGLLNLTPRFLIVSAEREQAAETLLAASSRFESQGSDNKLAPAWMSNLTLVVEPRLSDDAAYLAAGQDQIDTLEVAGLEEFGGVPSIDEAPELFKFSAKQWNVTHVIGARFLDWRGIVKIPISG